MRIVENSPNRVVLRDRTAWISFVCGGAAVIIAAIAISRGEPKALISAALFAMFAIAFLRTSDVIFDKVARSYTLRRRDMWRVTRKVIPFASIKDVLIDTMVSDAPGATFYRLSLSTSEGDVPFSVSYEADADRFEQMRSVLVNAIFGQASAPPLQDPVRALVAAGRSIDAISLLRQREGIGLTEAKARIDDIRRQIRLGSA